MYAASCLQSDRATGAHVDEQVPLNMPAALCCLTFFNLKNPLHPGGHAVLCCCLTPAVSCAVFD
jgi:hypothetical protein